MIKPGDRECCCSLTEKGDYLSHEGVLLTTGAKIPNLSILMPSIENNLNAEGRQNVENINYYCS